jgi:hypothetical protein
MVSELHHQYPAVLGTPAAARSDVAAYLANIGLYDQIPVAELLVSELATNSVLFADGGITLRAMWAGEVLHVDVSDLGGGAPVAREPGVSGRGMQIVAAFASNWGVNQFDGTGRTTWFELSVG